MRSPVQVMVVDDSEDECTLREMVLRKRFGDRIDVTGYQDPHAALQELGPQYSLILIDWRMPRMDGQEFLEEAHRKGIDWNRMVILSGTPVRYLHENFPMGKCLAVIEKGDPHQEEALTSIIDETIRISMAA